MYDKWCRLSTEGRGRYGARLHHFTSARVIIENIHVCLLEKPAQSVLITVIIAADYLPRQSLSGERGRYGARPCDCGDLVRWCYESRAKYVVVRED